MKFSFWGEKTFWHKWSCWNLPPEVEEQRDPRMYCCKNDMLETKYNQITSQWLLSKSFKIIWCCRDAQRERWRRGFHLPSPVTVTLALASILPNWFWASQMYTASSSTHRSDRRTKTEPSMCKSEPFTFLMNTISKEGETYGWYVGPPCSEPHCPVCAACWREDVHPLSSRWSVDQGTLEQGTPGSHQSQCPMLHLRVPGWTWARL